MNKFSKFICEHKILILVISIILLVPAVIGMEKTKINYDILVYLPKDIETIKGEDILTNDFNMGSFASIVTEGMPAKDMLEFESDIKKIDGVEKVISMYDVTGTTIPDSILPKDVLKKVKSGDDTLLLVTFKGSTSDEKTLDACKEIRHLAGNRAKMGGMSAVVLDTMNLSNKEVTIYVIIAVVLCIIVLSLALDSYLVPFLLLANIGIAILYNMGTNIFLGNISYITKAISAVLQLGVTTDFSIFLYHKYEHYKEKYGDINKAMERAIYETMTSIIGSSLTTIAGFLALCTMNLTLGKDIGIVMAKGVLLGLVCVLTVFPALLLTFDKLLNKTSHKELIPQFTHLNNFLSNHYITIFIIFLILLVPAWYGQKNAKVYYNLDKSLPDTLESSVANKKLKDEFNIVSPEMILVSKDLSTNKVNSMVDEIKSVKGIDMVLNPSELSKTGLDNLLSSDVKEMYETDKYKMIIINSSYKAATNKLNSQITDVNKIIKKYDKNAILAGEGPLMKDLITISDTDFHNVNYASLAAIFVILIFVLKSISLPVILIFIIEFAIFVNMGIPYYTGTTIPFVSSIVIGTIQLGATIDYTILMTTKYLEERKEGKKKHDSIKASLDASVNSIFVSGMCFFAATFGVGVYSKLDMISSLCTLISRGAIISMITVIMVLPSFLIIFDKLIIKTTKGFKGFKKEGKNMKSNNKKVTKKTTRRAVKAAGTLLISATLLGSLNVNALTKNETVYEKLDYNGKVKSTIVNEHLTHIDDSKEIKDKTNLTNILNVNGNEKFNLQDNILTFENKGKEIYYQGETESKSPVSINVSYKLDGKQISLNDLLGKSGKVEINLAYNNESYETAYVNGKRRTIYTPFVAVMTTVIPTKNVSNVEVTNGKVESTGNNNIIVALATPGLSTSLNSNKLNSLNSITIKYDVKNFKLNAIYNVVSNKLIDEDDIDVLDNVDEVYDNVTLLANSSKELVSGTNKLRDGAKSLNDGIKTANSGVKEINSKVKESVNALTSDTSDALDSKTVEAIKNAAINSANLTDDQKNEISTSAKKATLSELQKQTILSLVGKTIEEQKAAIEANAEKNISAKAADIKAQAIASIKESKNYKTLEAKDTGLKNLIKNYQSACLANPTAVDVALNNMKAGTTCETMQSDLLKVETSLAVMEQVAPEVAYQTAVNTAKETAYKTAVETASTVALQTSETVVPIASEKAALEAAQSVAKIVAAKSAETIAPQVANSVKKAATDKVSGNMKELVDGLNTLSSGMDKLENGSNELAGGADTLSAGMTKFDNDGISKINSLVNGDLKDDIESLKKIIDANNNYQTFTMKNDNDKSNTKFIMTIDSKEKKVTSKKKATKKNTKKSVFSIFNK